jgi:serine/threonine protein kinase
MKGARDVTVAQGQPAQVVGSVKEILREVTAESPFLQNSAPMKSFSSLGLFKHSEIRTGKILGKGAFSVVHEIVGFELEDEVSATMNFQSQRTRMKFQREAVDKKTGRARYVIKHLSEALLRKPNEFSLAASDLAVEAAFLIRLRHKHILSLRGFPVTGLGALEDGHRGFFLILDRLDTTLDRMIEDWKGQEQQNSSLRLQYSRQIASALKYLHRNRIVFRDLKSNNIGIDQDGRLRLFDFGLCRELPSPEAINEVSEEFMSRGVYEMSGVGTRRTMAPEVVLAKGYNCKADIYGWAIVVWEMFALARPYSSYSKTDHQHFVCKKGERPPLTSEEEQRHGRKHEPLKGSVPVALSEILKVAWDASLSKRCDAELLCVKLDELLRPRRPTIASAIRRGNVKLKQES